MHSKHNVTTILEHQPARDKNTEKYPGAGHLFPQWSLGLYAVPEWRRQEQVIFILLNRRVTRK